MKVGYWVMASLAFVAMAVASESPMRIVIGAGLIWFLGIYVVHSWLRKSEINFGWITVGADSSVAERAVYGMAGLIALLLSAAKLWGLI